MMLPLPLMDITDVVANASIHEGYNDNVVETRPAPDRPSERRGSPFTGVDVSISTTGTGERSVWSLRLGARGQHYTPLSGKLVGGDDGTVLLGWNAGWEADPRSQVTVGQSVMLTGQNTARLADMPMVTLDPSLGRQTFVFATTDLSWNRELTANTRTRVTLTGALRYMLSDTAPETAGAGIDYGGPRLENEWLHTLGARDTGALRAVVGYWYTPRALLDMSGRRGASQAWQVTPAVVWGHEISESWRSEVVGGASFVTTTNETFTSSNIVPAASGQLAYEEDSHFALFSYALGVDVIAMSFGPGLTHSVGARYGGPLGRSAASRRFVAGVTGNASRASVPTSTSTSFVVMTAAAGGLLRYSLVGDWLGLLVGYEGQYLNMMQAGGEASPSTSFYRNIAFVGIAGSMSSMQGTLPLDVPRPPPR